MVTSKRNWEQKIDKILKLHLRQLKILLIIFLTV